MNLVESFFATAERHGERVAIIAGDGTPTTFRALIQRAASLAAAWKGQGIGPGDRVLLAMPLGADLYAAIAALWQLGAVVVFPEPAMGLKGLRHAVTATAPKAFLSAGSFRFLRYLVPELWRVKRALRPHPAATPLAAIHPADRDHPALISFTSGSTGKPKGIVRSHGFLAAQNACVAAMVDPGDAHAIDLVAFPVFVIVNLGLGITSVLPDWRLTRHDQADPAAVARLIAACHVTRLLVPPSICEKLAEGTVLPGITTVFTGGGPVFPDLLQRLAAKLPQADIVSVYGSTEAEPIAHQHMAEISPADWESMRAGGGLLAGAPIPEIAVTLIEDEIVVSGEHVNQGYLDGIGDATNKLRRDGRIWHRTGDAGRFDDRGRLWLLGRKEAKAGGIYPFAIEVAARFWPGVRRAALVAEGTASILAVEGDRAYEATWSRAAESHGAIRVVPVTQVPLDRRHRSKVDYGALRRMLRGSRQ